MTPAELEAAKRRERDFSRAMNAPIVDVKLGGPIRRATWNEPDDYFASNHKSGVGIMTPAERARAIARCDEEIAEIMNRADVVAGTAPAWLVTLGVEDWEAEKRAIEREATGMPPEWWFDVWALWIGRACFVCGRRGVCPHREISVAFAEIQANPES